MHQHLAGLRVGGLCCGYGGLELVIEHLGGRTVWMVENDSHARRVLRTHWPKVKIHHDLRYIDWTTMPRVDVIVAGFPCQPVSQAGRQRGVDDDRWLWPWIAECIRSMAPSVVMLENVRGLLTANGGAAMAEVLGSLAGLGFDAEWGCQTASGVGACHRRERWFCVAVRRGRGWVASHADSMVGAPTDPGRRGRRQVEHQGQESGALGPDGRDGRGDVALLPTPTATYPGGEPARYRARLTEHDGRAGEFVALNMVVEQAHAALHDRYGPAIEQHARLVGRPAPPPVFNNQRSRSGVSLSPAFVEWMMCLGAGHVTDLDIARTNQLKLLGNGVVPPQAAHAYDQLFQRLSQPARQP